MNKTSIDPLPQFFDRYIIPVEESDVFEALQNSLTELETFDRTYWSAMAHFRYAEGKWTVLELLQHILDNERIQSARALRFSRKDKNPLPGYDENLLAANSEANNRSVDQILDELLLLRKSNLLMFASFSQAQFLELGTASGIQINALALAFMLVGHQRHHLNVLGERYKRN